MPKNEALAIMPAGDAPLVTPEQMELVKRTVAKDATPDELKLYFFDCQRQGVHPLDKLIHFTKRAGKYTPITSIDFMRTRASDSGDYAGNDDATFQVASDGKHPDSASVTVYRLVQGQRCAFTATARWSEYLPEQAFMWKKMPFTMLGKCAEALALRKAFPRQLSGLYAAEEMAQSGRKIPEEQGELHEPDPDTEKKAITLAGVIENEKEKDGFYWYAIKTLTNAGETTVQVRSPKETDSGRLAEKVGYLVSLRVMPTDSSNVFSLMDVVQVRKPVETGHMSVVQNCTKLEDFNAAIGLLAGASPDVKLALVTRASELGFRFERGAKSFVAPVAEQPKTSPKKQTAPKAAPDAKEAHTWNITEPQRKRMFALAKDCGFDDSQLRNLAGKFGVEHLHEMTPKQYKEITGEMEQYIGAEAVPE